MLNEEQAESFSPPRPLVSERPARGRLSEIKEDIHENAWGTIQSSPRGEPRSNRAPGFEIQNIKPSESDSNEYADHQCPPIGAVPPSLKDGLLFGNQLAPRDDRVPNGDLPDRQSTIGEAFREDSLDSSDGALSGALRLTDRSPLHWRNATDD